MTGSFGAVASGEWRVSSEKNCPEDNGFMPLNLFMASDEKIIKGTRLVSHIIMDDRKLLVLTMGYFSPLLRRHSFVATRHSRASALAKMLRSSLRIVG